MDKRLDKSEICLLANELNNIKFNADQYYENAGLTKEQQIIHTHSNNWLRLHGKQPCPKRIRKKIKKKIIQYNREKFFGILEETIDRVISNSFTNDEFYNRFVDIKDITIGEIHD